jgi:predicted flap endonuclease-1-like 5' DNA nuclease
LLARGGTPAGRKEIAAKSGVSDALILQWVNHVDLFRIKGVGSEYADLLEAAGVDTVVELAQRNPDQLHPTLLATNQSKKLVRRPPGFDQVRSWIQQAKKLPRKVSY